MDIRKHVFLPKTGRKTRLYFSRKLRLTMGSLLDRKYDIMFREPVFSYCFNAKEPVEIYDDNTHDHRLFRRGELYVFEHDWEKDIKDAD